MTLVKYENSFNIIDSLEYLHLLECTRQSLLKYFDNTWRLTETLFDALKIPEAFYQVPYHQLRHPLIFYYCHPAVFYINKFRLAGLLNKPVNAYFEELFETGVDEMSWDDMSKNSQSWPPLVEVISYRSKVYKLIKKIIEEHAGFEKLLLSRESGVWVLLMCFEHERIHIETSSVLFREMSHELFKKPAQWPNYYPIVENSKKQPCAGIEYPCNQFIDLVQGEVQLGKPPNWPSYG